MSYLNRAIKEIIRAKIDIARFIQYFLSSKMLGFFSSGFSAKYASPLSVIVGAIIPPFSMETYLTKPRCFNILKAGQSISGT